MRWMIRRHASTAREWYMNAGYGGRRWVRQLLAAKPGQQPSLWIDFDNVRSSLQRWSGYCIIAVERTSAVVVAANRV